LTVTGGCKEGNETNAALRDKRSKTAWRTFPPPTEAVGAPMLSNIGDITNLRMPQNWTVTLNTGGSSGQSTLGVI
jgi:hypothetical protein